MIVSLLFGQSYTFNIFNVFETIIGRYIHTYIQGWAKVLEHPLDSWEKKFVVNLRRSESEEFHLLILYNRRPT